MSGPSPTSIPIATPCPIGVFTLQQFRDVMPRFSDPTKYPNPVVQMYLTLATTALDVNRWKDFWPIGVMLYVAHSLKMDELAESGSSGGLGIMTSKSLGPGSVGYDIALASEKDAGNWNQTLYGRRFYNYAMLVGTGAIQILPGGSSVPDSGSGFIGPSVSQLDV